MGQTFLRIAISSVFLVVLLMFRSSHHQEPTRQQGHQNHCRRDSGWRWWWWWCWHKAFIRNYEHWRKWWCWRLRKIHDWKPCCSYVVTVGKAETLGSQFIIKYYHNRGCWRNNITGLNRNATGGAGATVGVTWWRVTIVAGEARALHLDLDW
jgi:hypothetical protein